MNGNYGNNTLNPFSVPPPNFNPRASSWNNNWKQNETRTNANSNTSTSTRSHFPNQPLKNYQNNQSHPYSSQVNGKYVYAQTQEKKENEEKHTISNGEVSQISIPPPPLHIYMGTPKTSNVYSAQHIFSTSGLPTSLSYQGAVTYVPIPAETYSAHHAYYPPPPPPPIQHNPPPPPPPTSGHYPSTSTQRPFYYNKRKLPPDLDYMKKMNNNKKKKKPLSQNIPQRKDWSVEDAKRAIELEKEYNKRNRSASLIIKFPDTELNRDIVARFHPSIDTVHFQQPSTPRFCFVTLKDGVNAEEVIEKLNKTRFGQGFLSVEYKKDREEDMNIGPEDIDPLTLYVGNLAQDVMKEDMVKIYPKHKRVDIGYAKKMKYTRYAFVSFKNVDDSIEAFKKTHSTQLYSKSLIVRFRRLHGTVGMPGEPKPQLPQKHSDNRSHDDDYTHEHDETSMCEDSTELSPWDMVDVSQWYSDRCIKQETIDDGTDEENEEIDETFASLPIIDKLERKPVSKMESSSNTVSKLPVNKIQEKHCLTLSPVPSAHFKDENLLQDIDESKPIVKEDQLLQNSSDTSSDNNKNPLQISNEETEEKPSWLVDQKPLLPIRTNLSFCSTRSGPLHKPFIEPKKENLFVDEEKIEVETPKLSVDSSFLDMNIKSEVEEKTSEEDGMKCSSVDSKNEENEIKSEAADLVGETNDENRLEIPLVSVKNEPVDQDEEIKEDDDKPLDDEDDFDFGNLLSNFDEKNKKLKKLKEMVL